MTIGINQTQFSRCPCGTVTAAGGRVQPQGAAGLECNMAHGSQRQRADGSPRLTVAERFWSKVDRRGADECWPWLAYRDGKGYGQFYDGNKLVKAHRMARELTCGSLPDGASLLHRCDHPWCCNPGHTFPGTQADNTADMVAKGRARGCRGEANPQAKLSEQGVKELRRRHADGESCAALARWYGIGETVTRKIVKREKWSHVQ